MERFEQHGEFSTRGLFSQGRRARVSLTFEHAGARLSAAARALRGAPLRAPAAGLMVLAAALGTSTGGLTAGDPGNDAFRVPAGEAGLPAEPLDIPQTETLHDELTPEALDDGAVDGDHPDSEILEPDTTCAPDRVKPLGPPQGIRVAWSSYDDEKGRSTISVRDLDGDTTIDVSGGCDAYRAVLHGGTKLTYVVSEQRKGEYREVLMMADLTTGEHHRLTHRTSLMAFSWDPTGSKLASIDQGTWTDDGEPLGSSIEILDVASGDVQTITIDRSVDGRCGWLGDESALHWSPDGSMIALVMTAFDDGETLRVLDLAGNDLVDPRAGTMARWLDDQTLIYAQYGHDVMKGSGWLMLDVSSGDESPIHLQPDTYAPALSPSGARVATFSDDGTLYVHTLANRRERSHHGLINAHWIDQRHVLATDVRICDGDCYYEFEEVGSSSIVDVVTGERTPVDIPSTWGASVWVPPSEQLDAA